MQCIKWSTSQHNSTFSNSTAMNNTNTILHHSNVNIINTQPDGVFHYLHSQLVELLANTNNNTSIGNKHTPSLNSSIDENSSIKSKIIANNTNAKEIKINSEKFYFENFISTKLKLALNNPSILVKNKLQLNKFEDIIKMENNLRKKNKQLQVLVSHMEQSLLLKHDQNTNAKYKIQNTSKNNTDCYADSSIDNSYHKHLKHTEERTREKYVLNLNGMVSKCKSAYEYDTDSSSEDECFQSCVNLAGPKKRKLSAVHKKWLETRTAIGSKWSWLDLQLAIIDNEISKVSTKLMEIKSINFQCSLPDPDPCARCVPFTPPPSGKKHLLYRKEPAKRSQSLDSTDIFEYPNNNNDNNNNNNKQHINLNNPFSEDIARSSMLYDAVLKLSYKHYSIDAKDIKKLEQFTSSRSRQYRLNLYRNSKLNSKLGFKPKFDFNGVHSKNSFRPSSITSLIDFTHPATTPTKHSTAHSQFRQKRARSYDTTHIIIPASSVPKLEKPVYSEIITPGWRIYNINDNNNINNNNNSTNNNNNNNNNCDENKNKNNSEIEAISQEVTIDLEFENRHSKCELLEKQSYIDTLHYPTPTTASSNNSCNKKYRRISTNTDTTSIQHITEQYFPVRKFPLSDFEFAQLNNNCYITRKQKQINTNINDNTPTSNTLGDSNKHYDYN